MRAAHFILYVADQAASTRFYAAVLGQQPRVDMPGMTEFELSPLLQRDRGDRAAYSLDPDGHVLGFPSPDA